MNIYKRSSHIRSVLKGITWRVIATLDTVLVVLLITCFLGECSIDNALSIGLAEFVLKLFIYYIHERIWELRREHGGATKKKTLLKSISWRILASIATFIVAGVILKGFDSVALAIVGVESVTKFILYYAHERIWLRLPLGKVRLFFLKHLKRQ